MKYLLEALSKMRTSLNLILPATIWLILSYPVFAGIPTMTVSEIQPGMRGIGKTVIKGTQIEEFNCEVIDVFKDMGYNGGPLILLRISGDVVNRSGGIAGGYSGSPVFINGKLIGALSWGPYFTKGDVVGATPINEMLKTFTYSKKETIIGSKPTCLNTPLDINGIKYESVLLAADSRQAEDLHDLWGDNTLILTPCRTPLIVSGLSQKGFERLKDFAKDKLPYIDIIQGPGGGESKGVPLLLGPTVLEPGASIGAQLASGDLDLTAVGTLTWVDDSGRFLAFGHPFLADGPTNLPFVTTKIVHTIAAMDRSYKLGEPIEVVGTTTQDRLTGIGGQLRQIPDMVDFHLTVTDKNINKTRRYNFSTINKEEWLPFIGWIMPMEGLLYASDRDGKGTCKISFSLRGEGLAEPIQRENLVYAMYSVSSEALNEFTEALMMITSMNFYREVKLTNVEIKVEITNERRTMDIIKARFKNPPNIGPGAIGYKGPEESNTSAAQNEAPVEAPYSPDTNETGILQIQDIPQEIPTEGNLEVSSSESSYLDYSPQYAAPVKLVGYRPGDKVEILVTLRPYRQAPIEKVITLTIPPDFKPGQTSIEILGGTSYYPYSAAQVLSNGNSQGSMYSAPIQGQPETLDEIIDLFKKRCPYNSLIVRLVQPPPQDPYFFLQDGYKLPDEIRSVISLDQVIYGYYTLPIEILSDEKTSANGSAAQSEKTSTGEATPQKSA